MILLFLYMACVHCPAYIEARIRVLCQWGEPDYYSHPLKLPVSERGDCSGLMLLHERDMHSRDCRGDGGSTAVEECTLESLKRHVLRTIPVYLISNHLHSHLVSFCHNSIRGPYGLEFSWIQCSTYKLAHGIFNTHALENVPPKVELGSPLNSFSPDSITPYPCNSFLP